MYYNKLFFVFVFFCFVLFLFLAEKRFVVKSAASINNPNDNSLFFSKISSLSSNDEIFIFDNNGMKYIYFVYDIYEVSQSDLSPVLNYEINQKILTLVTCNNFNSNRIIIKAKQK